MNNQEDSAWQSLLAQSASTFTGNPPPFGFVTSMTARLRSERGQVEEIERIGWRALMASLCTLAVVAAISFSITMSQKSDFEPGTRSLVQMDNFQFS